MAGLGKRFEQAGYTVPKPMIEIDGTKMIELVVNNLNINDGRYIFITQKKHCEEFGVRSFLKKIVHDCTVIELDGLTEGAACTILKVKDLINNDEELITANSDQLVMDFDYCGRGTNFFRRNDRDGGIWCFVCQHPKWSYAKVDDNYIVTEVAEKKPISNLATVGVYYFKKGSDFVQSAEKMIEKNIRVNGEFYLCPVYNQMIESGKKVGAFLVNEMIGLGTPEDVRAYKERKINGRRNAD
jgi:dTDP-glucose pyrophosphorylase